MKNRILWLSLLTLVFAGMVYSLLQPESHSESIKQILQARQEKNHAFRVSDQSPLTPELRKIFKGLEYFPPDPSWIISADFIPLSSPDTLEMAMNDGDSEIMLRVGFLEFVLKEKRFRLAAFRNPYDSHNRLFIPFKDESSGLETYGGGRYLDAESGRESVVLNFNSAYNPFCAYNPDYVCILPPTENLMQIQVLAGEKIPLSLYE